MENGYRLRVAFAVASIAAISLYFTVWYNRRRKQKSGSSSCYLHAEQKPQYAFKRVLADNSYAPFKHLKLTEPNNENASNSHPFEAEITALLNDLQPETELITGNADLTVEKSFIWVETESQLEELVHVLNKETFFAVDTEQHSFRSFLGFTALIQVSTQTEDYLVDTIALHDYMAILRSVFANPCICKVFHGADNDVVWLQRDFHIYIVNLFDTAKACEVLSKPQKSLAYLLETYCGVTTNKILQREDWRQRPLSAEMIEYAQTDAHYLLYIAKCLISELKQKGDENSSLDDKFHFVLEANRRSNMICLQLYSKDIDGPPGESAAVSLFSRFVTSQEVSNGPSEAEFQVLVRKLCAWRDLMARVHDESLRYVLSDQAIVNLANKAPVYPTDIYDCIAQADLNSDLGLSSLILNPSSLVSCHFDDICYVLQKKLYNPNNMFTITLKKCLGPNGSCPLSVFNNGLLVNPSLKIHLVRRQGGHKNHKPVARKASRDLFVKKFSCKTPVYHNCRIYANDGRLLCYCDRRKLEWYLQRNLAKLVYEDPPAIMLLFEPKGRPEDEGNEFYVQSKKNICVGCGERSHYLRYRIIPSCYRMHFPEHLKSHRSHDIVLLCVDCHEVAHAAAEKYKRKIADEFRIPLYVKRVAHSEIGPLRNLEQTGVSPLQLRTAAMALLRHGERMPSSRREELIEIVRKYYGGREISEVDLERALLIGMSPHERRRLEKKRGSAFKHSKRTACQETARDTSDGAITNLGKLLASKVDAQDCSAIDEAVGTSEDNELLMNEHTTNSMGSELMANGAVRGTQNGSSNARILDETSDCDVNGDHGLDERSQLNGSIDLYDPGNGQTMEAKHNSKLSLLGHGPHGKQVVDHLLKEYGEEGVREFCQRWRQVFVDALRPRFLPAGWNVKHSGRRDFGDFSVYNPMKSRQFLS